MEGTSAEGWDPRYPALGSAVTEAAATSQLCGGWAKYYADVEGGIVAAAVVMVVVKTVIKPEVRSRKAISRLRGEHIGG